MTPQASPSLLGVELSFRGARHLFIASNAMIQVDMGFAAWRDNQPHCHMISANGGGISEGQSGYVLQETVRAARERLQHPTYHNAPAGGTCLSARRRQTARGPGCLGAQRKSDTSTGGVGYDATRPPRAWAGAGFAGAACTDARRAMGTDDAIRLI